MLWGACERWVMWGKGCISVCACVARACFSSRAWWGGAGIYMSGRPCGGEDCVGCFFFSFTSSFLPVECGRKQRGGISTCARPCWGEQYLVSRLESMFWLGVRMFAALFRRVFRIFISIRSLVSAIRGIW